MYKNNIKNRLEIKRIIKWTARIWGSICLAFLLYFFVASLFGTEGIRTQGFKSFIDLITFLLFPVLPVAGLIISWKREGLGGILILGGFICLFAIRPDLLQTNFLNLFFIPPGLLFFLYWLLTKFQKKDHENVMNV